MSLSAYPVKTLIVDDPRIDQDRVPHYIIERSAGDITYRQYQSTSFSSSSITIDTTPPSRDTVVSTKVRIRVPMRIDLTGVGNPLLPNTAAVVNATQPNIPEYGARSCLRFAPFHQICNNMQVTLNGKTFTEQINRYYEPLMRYGNKDEELGYTESKFPSAQDEYINYADANRYGFVNDPMRRYGDSDKMHCGRLGYMEANITSITNGLNAASIDLVVEEDVSISPLCWGDKPSKGIVGLDTLNLFFAISNPQRVWSNDAQSMAPNVINTVNVSITSAPIAEFTYLKPRLSTIIPLITRYPYYLVREYNILGSNLAPGGSGQTNFQNIQLSQIPRRMYIFARRRDNDLTFNSTDTYARIDKININFGNRSGILGEASTQTLYKISQENGFRESFSAWNKYVGSVLCLDFGKDIPLDALQAPGALQQAQFYFTLDYTNTSDGLFPANVGAGPVPAIQYSIYCVVIYEGMMINNNGQILIETGDVSQLDIINSDVVTKVPYDMCRDYLSGGMYGYGPLDKLKSGFEKLKDFGKKAKPYVSKGSKIVKELSPYIQSISPRVGNVTEAAADFVNQLLGQGYTEDEIYSLVQSKVGSGLMVGGKKMPKDKLKMRAIKYR